MLKEFEKIAERSGVLGAMETSYQRGQIREESMHCEMQKHTGAYSIVGVNTFRNPQGDPVCDHIELARSTDEEKQSQLKRLHDFRDRHAGEAPATLRRLQKAAIDNGNVFGGWWRPFAAVRWVRSRPRCSRSVGGTGAACRRIPRVRIRRTRAPGIGRRRRSGGSFSRSLSRFHMTIRMDAALRQFLSH